MPLEKCCNSSQFSSLTNLNTWSASHNTYHFSLSPVSKRTAMMTFFPTLAVSNWPQVCSTLSAHIIRWQYQGGMTSQFQEPHVNMVRYMRYTLGLPKHPTTKRRVQGFHFDLFSLCETIAGNAAMQLLQQGGGHFFGVALVQNSPQNFAATDERTRFRTPALCTWACKEWQTNSINKLVCFSSFIGKNLVYDPRQISTKTDMISVFA